MRRNPYLFSPEEYAFLHHIYLKQPEETKLYKRIKTKRGIGLDKTEVLYIKRRFSKWKQMQESENQIMFINGTSEF